MEQYKNFVAVVLDKAGYEILLKEGYPVFYYKNDLLSVDEASSSTRMWTSSAFSKMVLKLVIIRDLLRIKLRVLYLDSDIRLFKDPFPILRDYESYDMAAQRDDTLCAGFMYLQPTTETIRLFHLSVNEMYRRGIMDQDALSIVVHQSSSLRFVYLPTLLFMSGREYSRYHQFFWDKNDIDKDIVMYHNNFIIYEHNKMYRWREQGLLTDDNGYYDLSPNGYLLVDNINWNLCSPRMKSTPFFEGMKQLAHLVVALNRTLIMPALPCPDTVKVERCTLCAYNDVCANGFQKVIHYNYKAYVSVEQILFDERSPVALRKQFEEGPVYRYQCVKDKKTVVQNNTIRLGQHFTDADLNPFKDTQPLLLHVENVPSCLKKMRFDVSGFQISFLC
ncbi:hypothetical protein JH06_2310 [Blastocystis sp. subtype 4]|uniref:hypothetical protein n=1 Tax=Blastocystis sp. subtype 4 TaxID=944170 RepID=UPI000711EBF4|nr:hypothetical protein JH06_2310 [Blastocystis sp. subtype 4]KNB45273.1 hypothetical protein JH06_2310 [Blastocystis sp. subtype 4]|eukprot:XP_014528716.1 hypothetical protein JH06_2310 [Blastocystis sp. subtype 4]